MRLLIVSAAFLVTTTAAAQSRWTFSAGPEWRTWFGTRLWAMRMRAEYDLTRPSTVFGLRLEGGVRWAPTQGYFNRTGPFTISGEDQTNDVMFGLSGAIAPFPLASVSPYVTMGVLGRQTWSQGSQFVRDSTLLSAWSTPKYIRSRGDIIFPMGVGLRTRFGGRSFQLELRRLYYDNSLTFGTRLPF